MQIADLQLQDENPYSIHGAYQPIVSQQKWHQLFHCSSQNRISYFHDLSQIPESAQRFS